MLRLRFAIVAAALLAGAPAAAQSSDPAAAQALFDDAKALMRSGDYAEACPKLEQSQRLDPGGGTLVALGLCYEGLGRTASAWTTWNLALSSARSEHRTDREAIALKHIPALEQKMPRARVVVTAPPASSLEVRRDGVAISSAEYGTAVPIDPGQHTFEATAPGKVPWKTLLVIPPEAKTYEVDVPALKDAAAAPSPSTATSPASPPPAASPAPVGTAPAAASVAPTPPAASRETAPASAGDSTRTWAWITGGVGVAALAAGGIFGLVASSKWSDAHQVCPNDLCTGSKAAAAVSEGTTAGHEADVATVLVGAGVVAVGVSAILFLTSGSGESTATTTTGAVHVAPLVGSVNGLSVTGSLW